VTEKAASGFNAASDVAPLNESDKKIAFPSGGKLRKGRRMKRSRFNEEQIVAILKQGETGMKRSELCRRWRLVSWQLSV